MVAPLRREIAPVDAAVDLVVRAPLAARSRSRIRRRASSGLTRQHDQRAPPTATVGTRRQNTPSTIASALPVDRRERRQLAVQRVEIEVALVVQRRLGVGVQAREIQLALEVVDVQQQSPAMPAAAHASTSAAANRDLPLPSSPSTATMRRFVTTCGRMRQSGVNSWTSAAPGARDRDDQHQTAARSGADRKPPARAPSAMTKSRRPSIITALIDWLPAPLTVRSDWP